VKYERSATFKANYKDLSKTEKVLLRAAVREINEAFFKREGSGLPKWPEKLRIQPVQGASGIWEMTWSFSGPDGRATFEIVGGPQGPILRWRRIGGHSIFRSP
jgi:hypothetical protein